MVGLIIIVLIVICVVRWLALRNEEKSESESENKEKEKDKDKEKQDKYAPVASMENIKTVTNDPKAPTFETLPLTIGVSERKINT